MEISWLGHSCFKLKGSESTVITDPFSPDLGIPLSRQSAQIITVSQNGRNHAYTQSIDDNPKILKGPGEYEIGGVLIIGVATFQDGSDGELRGKNTAYVMEIDDITICHLGNLGHLLNGEQLEDIESIDILLVPVGGTRTINAAQAAELVRKIEPGIVIPMHYGTDMMDAGLDPVNKFLSEVGVSGIEPVNKLVVTRSNVPESTRIVLLNY